MEQAFYDTIGLAHQFLGSILEQSTRDLPAITIAKKIEDTLNELEGALALIPDLNMLVLWNDWPYIRKFYTGPPFISEGTSGPLEGE